MFWPALVLGILLGGVLSGGSGAILGALVGALLGRQWDIQANRLRALETRVQQLETSAAMPGLVATPQPTAAEPAEAIKAEVTRAEVTKAGEPAVEALQPVAPVRVSYDPDLFSPTRDDTLTQRARSLWSRWLAGNLLAKAGVAILFFGVASGLKLAAEYGWMPPQLRLALASLAGMVMILFGRQRLESHRMFGLALQGGGFAVLYLVLYFAYGYYHYLDKIPAFIGFAALGVACVLTAARQENQALAVLGLSGAFFAPELASDDGGSHIILFSYFLLLDAFIIAVSARKAWRTLNLAGLVYTAVFSLLWAHGAYQPDMRLSVSFFLLLFVLLYSITPALIALYRQPGSNGWMDGSLLFGPPTFAALVLRALFADDPVLLGLAAVSAGAYYFGLWRMARDSSNAVLRGAFAALSVTFATLAIPQLFGATVTSLFWALEGLGVLWVGEKQNRLLPRMAGLAMQLLAGLWLWHHAHDLQTAWPLLNERFPAMLAVGLGGLASAWLLRRDKNDFGVVLLVWGLAWSLFAGWMEADQFMAASARYGAILAWAAFTFAALERAGTRHDWQAARNATLLLLPLTLIVTLWVQDNTGHPLGSGLVWAFPVSMGVLYWILHRHERNSAGSLITARHVGLFWLLAGVASVEAAWLAGQRIPGFILWRQAAFICVLSGLVLLSLAKCRCWPLFGNGRIYHRAALPVMAIATLATVAFNIDSDGGWAWTYWPLFNPQDMTTLLALYTLWRLGQQTDIQEYFPRTAFPGTVGAGVLLWLTAIVARTCHHWMGMAYTLDALLNFGAFLALTSLLWATAAFALMLTATRKQWRRAWMGGFALLVLTGLKLLLFDLANAGPLARTASLLGVGLIVLATSYFSPLPPHQESEEP